MNPEAGQIMATIRNRRMVNIGGRPVIVPDPIARKAKMSSHESREKIRMVLAFVAIYLIWGSTFLAIRYAVETIPPLTVAGMRHAIAGSVLLVWAWARGFRPTRQQWLAAAPLGCLFFLLGHGTLCWAEQHVNLGLAALLMATEAIFILVLGWMLGQQRITWLSAVGVGLGIVGVGVLTGGGGGGAASGYGLIAMLAVLFSSFAWSAGVVISPRLKLPSDALGRTALPTLCGAAMLLVAAGVSGEFQHVSWASMSLRSVFGLGYLITFGSIVAFTSYIWLLQRVPPTLVATHTYINPVVAVILGWLLASEPLNLRVIGASVAILGAIVLIRRGERPVQGKAPEVENKIRIQEECA
jgi:drug/metabolite transporter (DMT)-like permease